VKAECSDIESTDQTFAPQISVVLPFRNAQHWLPQLLAALVREWHVSFELIAVDDHSNDGSASMLRRLCAHWPSARWRLLLASGHGVSAARNQAVVAARASVIAFLDADDRPLPGRLEGPLAILQAHPELDHVHAGWWRCDVAGQLQHAVRPWQEGAGFLWQQMLEHKAVLPSAWTVRRDAFLKVGGFDVGLSHAEDVDLLVRLAAAGSKGKWIEELLVRYRVHPGSASAQLEAQLQGLFEVLDRHLETIADDQQPWARQLRYDTKTWGCWLAWSEAEPQLALSLLSQALLHCPYALAKRPVHLLEVFCRSCARVGQAFDRASFQDSPFWQQAEAILLSR